MHRAFIICIALLSLPAASFSSGFGWRASIVRWDDLRAVRDNGLKQSTDLIAEQPSSEKLKLHFQIQLDNEINGKFCLPTDPDGYRVTPRQFEFFPKDFLSWAAETQRGRGIKNSIFFLFQRPPMFVKISSDSKYEKRRDLWFVIEPESIAGYLAEVKEFNSSVKAPTNYTFLARYLEGVLLLTDSDRYPEQAAAYGEQGRSALFLCGYD